MTQPPDPPGYPKQGTYADLLLWHLYVWGTRPGGSTTTRPMRVWDTADFIEAAYAGKPVARADRTYESWVGGSGQSAPRPRFAAQIAKVLFNGDVQYERWKRDLHSAWERSFGAGRNVATLDIADAVSQLPRADLAHAQTTGQPSSLFAAARENVELIERRLTKQFFGRSSELVAIDQFVESRMAGGTNGLMVVTAPAGFGKSALAAHWCANAAKTPRRRIARHFCSTSAGDATTSVENILGYLRQQISEIFECEVDGLGHLDALVSILSRTPPDNIELIVWLDGVDEASGPIPCFLPKELGEKVCVIISARADDGVVPGYLGAWLTQTMATSHEPSRFSLSKLSAPDVAAVVDGIFETTGSIVPQGLSKRIFSASDDGHALFVYHMTEGAIDAINKGMKFNLEDSPNALLNYAKRELEELETLANWPDLNPLFALLTVAREALRLDELPTLLGRAVFPRAIPREVARWLSLVEDPARKTPALLSFSHPKLAEIFKWAIGGEIIYPVRSIINNIIKLPFNSWPRYALRHLPHHLLDMSLTRQASDLLANFEFVSARFEHLGADASPRIMAADWMNWYGSTATNPDNHDDYVRKMQHLRLWNNSASQLESAAAQGFLNTWRHVVQDAGLHNFGLQVGLTQPSPSIIPTSLATLRGHTSTVLKIIPLEGDAGFLSCSSDETLRLWGPGGEEGPILRGHEGSVFGALPLKNGGGFLSWSADGTLRLWGQSGELGPVLRGHAASVGGALALEADRGFLSWSDDETLRLWDPSGDEGPLLRGHRGRIRGALALQNGAGFLSWAMDRIPRMWGSKGEERGELRGHEDFVRDALILTGRNRFLTWSNDATLRLWDASGRETAVLRGHKHWIKGAAALPDGAGFLSWSEDSLRMWGPNGEPGPVLRGHSDSVDGALVLDDGSGFLSWSEDKTLRLWGPSGQRRAVLRGHESRVGGALALEGSTGFLSWGGDSTLRLWGPDGEVGPIMRGHESGLFLNALAVPGRKGFLSWGLDGAPRLWAPADEPSITEQECETKVVSAHPLKGRPGFYLRNSDGSLTVGEPASEETFILRDASDSIEGAIALNNGAGFLSWNSDGKVRLRGPDGAERAAMPGHTGWVGGALELGTDRGFLTWGSDGTLRLWGPSGETRPIIHAHKGHVGGALSLERDTGFLSWGNRTIRLWGPAGEEGLTLKGHQKEIWEVLAIRGGENFVSWSLHEKVLRLWSRASSKCLSLRGHSSGVVGALLLKGGEDVLSWSYDGTLIIWNYSGKRRASFVGHNHRIWGASELLEGNGFLSWSADGTLRLWEPTGRQGPVFSGHQGEVHGAIELPNGAGFVSWGKDRTLRRWDTHGVMTNLWVCIGDEIWRVKLTDVADEFLVMSFYGVSLVRLPARPSH